MKMTKFRVQNYKKIEDTGWVSVGQMTAFVGKNESGKSAVFRGLSKLNPSDREKYDGLKEFPRRRYTSEFEQKNWPVSSAVFELTEEEADQLSAVSPIFDDTKSVTASRGYDGKLQIAYDPPVQWFYLKGVKFAAQLNVWKSDIQKLRSPKHADTLPDFKANLCTVIDGIINTVKDQQHISHETVKELRGQIETYVSEDWQSKLIKNTMSDIGDIESKLLINDAWLDGSRVIAKNLPLFVYFNQYDTLDSAIQIDEFIEKSKKHPDDPRLRITECLFEHVGLDIEKIRDLNPVDEEATSESLRRMADERRILMTSAAESMTQNFSSWWDQRKHKFHYGVDNLQFRVWVSDDLDSSEIELEERSAGMQYFFSFFLVFLTEAKGKHRNSILLLDEPGLQFHGTAQQKMVEFLYKLSNENQLLYTTHSAFMLDADHLESIRIVTEDEKNFGSTRVSDNTWPEDSDALFPLQAGLGYKLAQTLFYSKHQVVVEGITDFMYLRSINGRLSGTSREPLHEDVVVAPVGGTRNIMRLASLLLANDVRIVTVLDGDPAGLKAKNDLKDILPDIVIVDDYTEKQASEIEDMFDEDFFIKAVKHVYPEVSIDFDENEQKINSVCKRITKMFERKSTKFSKYNVCLVILDWINAKNPPYTIDDKTLDRFEALFKRCNEVLKQETRI